MNQKLSLKDLPIEGQRVLMRVDFNVPIENGKITDDSRITASLPSIEYVLKQGASLILMSHLGRPKGRESKFSLAPWIHHPTGGDGRVYDHPPDALGGMQGRIDLY